MRFVTKWLWLAMFIIAALGGTSVRAEGEYWEPLRYKLTRLVNERCERVGATPLGEPASLQALRNKLIELSENYYTLESGGTLPALTYVEPAEYDVWGNPVTIRSILDVTGTSYPNGFSNVPKGYGAADPDPFALGVPVDPYATSYGRNFSATITCWEHFQEIYAVAMALQYTLPARYDRNVYESVTPIQPEAMAEAGALVVNAYLAVFGEAYVQPVLRSHATELRIWGQGHSGHTVGHMRAIALSALVKNEGGFLAGENSSTFCSSSQSLVEDFTQFERQEIKELQIDLDRGCHLCLSREDLSAVAVRFRVTYGEFPRDHALIGLAFIDGDMAIAQLSELRRILIG